MKLSFVIPAYNEEKFIGKCLESIIKETDKKIYDTEIIVVNNASQDRTGEIASSFPGVKVVNEPKKGLIKARQAGFLASSGELIANIDADNILPTDWVKKVFDEFNRDDKLVALSGPYIYYDLSPVKNFLVKIFYSLGYLLNIFYNFILRRSAILQGGNYIIKRSALEKIGGYNQNFDFYGEDSDIADRVGKVGKIKFTFKLPIFASGRRIKEEGIIIMGARYFINHIWAVFFKKPFTKSVNEINKH